MFALCRSLQWKAIVGVMSHAMDPTGSRQWVGAETSWGYIAGTGGKCHRLAKSYVVFFVSFFLMLLPITVVSRGAFEYCSWLSSRLEFWRAGVVMHVSLVASLCLSSENH